MGRFRVGGHALPSWPTCRLAGYLAALMMVQAMAMQTYGALAPFIRTDLGVSASTMGLVAAAPYVGTAAAAFVSGGWVDRHHARTTVLLTGLGIAASLLIAAGFSTVTTVILGLALAGVSRSAIPPLSDRLGYEGAPLADRGFVFGVKQTGTPIGSALAAMTLPPLASAGLGWQGALATTAAVVAGATVALRHGPDSAAPARRTVHDGAAGVARGGPDDDQWAGDTGTEDVRAAVATKLPLVRQLATLIAISAALGVFMSSAMTFLTLYLVDDRGLAPVEAARWFALFGLGGGVGRIACGWLSDRAFRGHRGLALATSAAGGGMIAIMLGVAADPLIATTGALTMLIFGFFAQGWVGVIRLWGTELAGSGRSGRAGGLLLGSMMLGSLTGPPVFGWLVDTAGGYSTSWTVMGTLALAASAAVLVAQHRQRRRPPSDHDTSR
ncbi:MFS transporter [Actinobacteria bacterium YIM 96077]|uniref:Major facilitator superfamily (MFS) profile domain-containing protein n=1 Tax=Phytoactinopolyspora halophila TaxID=1981511 RepID=A0A329QN86_9ACTN|nr:MFS transporter [Phytoactinopolyspora halophila]AYY12266.1 MFS transporter [Actinobacteria bacterium YIM 96077]RAW13817.1 hypothetical protein DPM12_12505 [Phytoactinopolyspora halophila]